MGLQQSGNDHVDFIESSNSDPPPDGASRILRSGAVLYQRVGVNGVLAPLDGADTKSVLRSQAAAVCGLNLSDVFYDFLSTSEGYTSNGSVGLTNTIPTTGRLGNGRCQFSMAGAGGVTNITQGSPGGPFPGGPAPLVGSADWDPWFISAGAIISAVSAAGEIGLVGLNTLGTITAVDGTSLGYLYLGVEGTQSTTQLSITTWDGSTKRRQLVTGYTIDLAANAYHHYALRYDGSGTLDVLVDGVIVFTLNTVGSIMPWPPRACLQFFMRTTNATVETVTLDYLYGATARDR